MYVDAFGFGFGFEIPKVGSFVPTDLAGLEVWLNLDTLSSPDWNDASGNLYHAVAGATPPTITEGVSAVFDGTNDYLTFELADFTVGHVFIVTTPGSSGTAGGGVFGEYGDTGIRRDFADPDGIWREGTDAANDLPFGGTFKVNGAATFAHAAGTKAIVECAPATPYTLAANHYQLGDYYFAGGRAYKGTIFEVIIYAAALSAGDATSVREYLASAHGITL